MEKSIEHGDQIKVRYCPPNRLETGDIVVYQINGLLWAHWLFCRNGKYWITIANKAPEPVRDCNKENVLGKVIKIKRGEQIINLDSIWWRFKSIWKIINVWLKGLFYRRIREFGLIGVILLVLAFALGRSVNGETGTSDKQTVETTEQDKVKVMVYPSIWLVSGNHSMRGGPPHTKTSWLIKHPLDNTMVSGGIGALEIRYHQLYSFDINFGYGNLEDGKVKDTDYDSSGAITNLSHSTNSGKTGLFSGVFSFCISGAANLKKCRVDLGLGYISLKNSVEYKSPTILIDTDDPANEGVSTNETWQTYDLLYSGIELQVNGELHLGNKWLMQGLIGYTPRLKARYNGTRYPDRSPGEQLDERISADGYALGYETKVNYYFNPNLLFMVGYKHLRFRAEGEDSNGTLWAGSWEKFKTDLGGLIFGITYHF